LLARIGTVTDLFAFPLLTSRYVELVHPLWTTHRLQARARRCGTKPRMRGR
jgi:hypothetical protein